VIVLDFGVSRNPAPSQAATKFSVLLTFGLMSRNEAPYAEPSSWLLWPTAGLGTRGSPSGGGAITEKSRSTSMKSPWSSPVVPAGSSEAVHVCVPSPLSLHALCESQTGIFG
jgi:hypothetical protein